jgi:hypothetical protein
VAYGLGIGMSVTVPEKKLPSNVRALALPGFPPAIIGAMWRGKTTPLLQAFIAVMQARARQLAAAVGC